MNEGNYYVQQKGKLLKKHAKLMAVGRPILEKRVGDEAANEAIVASAQEYEKLIPQLPYIGGKGNSFTDTVVEIASILALCRILRREGMPLDEIDEFVSEMAQAWIDRYPRMVRKLLGRLYMSNFWLKRSRKRALISQEKRYPGDFVFEVVEGEGDFEWGINYLECAIVKLFDRMGDAELTPAMCSVDYLLFPSIGIDLQRSGTIAQGCTHCDFRFKHNTLRTRNDLQA